MLGWRLEASPQTHWIPSPPGPPHPPALVLEWGITRTKAWEFQSELWTIQEAAHSSKGLYFSFFPENHCLISPSSRTRPPRATLYLPSRKRKCFDSGKRKVGKVGAPLGLPVTSRPCDVQRLWQRVTMSGQPAGRTGYSWSTATDLLVDSGVWIESFILKN